MRSRHMISPADHPIDRTAVEQFVDALGHHPRRVNVLGFLDAALLLLFQPSGGSSPRGPSTESQPTLSLMRCSVTSILCLLADRDRQDLRAFGDLSARFRRTSATTPSHRRGQRMLHLHRFDHGHPLAFRRPAAPFSTRSASTLPCIGARTAPSPSCMLDIDVVEGRKADGGLTAAAQHINAFFAVDHPCAGSAALPSMDTDGPVGSIGNTDIGRLAVRDNRASDRRALRKAGSRRSRPRATSAFGIAAPRGARFGAFRADGQHPRRSRQGSASAELHPAPRDCDR